MKSGELCYDAWIEEALRQVIERALISAAEFGLPGDHHFYITFKTDSEGIKIPSYLRVEHPDEMTIVLQHQYENLLLSDAGFAVTLRFKGKPENLEIPYSAITSFADPSVNFGLQLKTSAVDQNEITPIEGDINGEFKSVLKKYVPEKENGDIDGKNQLKTGEIITLDSFRKKRT